jgi:hypothetical protein
MAVRLEPVTESNWGDCIELQVTEDQRQYVASNLYSMPKRSSTRASSPAASTTATPWSAS